MIGLEIPRRHRALVRQATEVARQLLRPISRHYDTAEHEYPKELDLLAAMIDGLESSGAAGGAGAAGVGSSGGSGSGGTSPGGGSGGNLASVLSIAELCWGDVGLLLALPRQGLGNSALAAVATPEQRERFAGLWLAMAITEPGAGSDSAAIRATARLDGDHYVLNGEKIYVTSGQRADAVVVWASVDRSLGRAAIKPFLVPHGTPGFTVARVEDKLGIRASDTAALALDDCRIPADHLLGSPEVDVQRGFGGAMATFDNTRPLVAAMATGCARAALERTRELLSRAGVGVDPDRPAQLQSAAAARLLQMESDLVGAELLTRQAAWMADGRRPNSVEASMAKAKAGRVATAITSGCLELVGPLGLGETELLEKWARDAKILDIFEGTQQIQQLIIARRVLGLSSSELK